MLVAVRVRGSRHIILHYLEFQLICLFQILHSFACYSSLPGIPRASMVNQRTFIHSSIKLREKQLPVFTGRRFGHLSVLYKNLHLIFHFMDLYLTPDSVLLDISNFSAFSCSCTINLLYFCHFSQKSFGQLVFCFFICFLLYQIAQLSLIY